MYKIVWKLIPCVEIIQLIPKYHVPEVLRKKIPLNREFITDQLLTLKTSTLNMVIEYVMYG